MFDLLVAAALSTTVAQASPTGTPAAQPSQAALVPLPDASPDGPRRRRRGGSSGDLGVGASLGLVTGATTTFHNGGAAAYPAGLGATWGLAFGGETDVGRISAYYRRAGMSSVELYYGFPLVTSKSRSNAGGLAWRLSDRGDLGVELLAGGFGDWEGRPGVEFGARLPIPMTNRRQAATSKWTLEPGVIGQAGPGFSSVQFEVRTAVWSHD
jgi:hypothetical protein